VHGLRQHRARGARRSAKRKGQINLARLNYTENENKFHHEGHDV